MFRFSLALRLFACSVFAPSAFADKLAFVAGIDTYDNIRSLSKAVGDARAMDIGLAKLGFAVDRIENVTRSQFNTAWQDFVDKLTSDDDVAIFFAGHGIEIEGVYLLPRDIPKLKSRRQEQLKREAISFSEMIADLRQKKVKFSLIILDACRENPFDSDVRDDSRVGLPDLGSVKGSFIMYSAGARQFALDTLGPGDDNPNSVYTRTLLPMLSKPGLGLDQIARQVRKEVSRLAQTAQHVQEPAYYDGINDDVCLLGTQCNGVVRDPAKIVDPIEREYWDIVKLSTYPDVIQTYLDEYPNGVFAKLARGLQKQRLLEQRINDASRLEEQKRVEAEQKALQARKQAEQLEELRQSKEQIASGEREKEVRQAEQLLARAKRLADDAAVQKTKAIERTQRVEKETQAARASVNVERRTVEKAAPSFDKDGTTWTRINR